MLGEQMSLKIGSHVFIDCSHDVDRTKTLNGVKQ